MARKALTQHELYDLYQAAEGGSASALAQLRESSKYYGKKGNERIREFERADMRSNALTRAQHYLETQQGRNRFSRSGKLDAYEAYKNASEARRFIRSKTGTVARERKRESAVMEKLEKGGYLPEMSKADQMSFSKFLRSSAWDEIKKTMGSQVMKEVAEGISEGQDIEELILAYQDYEAGQIDFEEFTEGWIDV